MRSVASLLAVGWLWALSLAAAAAPLAQGGRIDLAGWNPQRDGIVSLDGEWSFVPGRFVGPTDPWPPEARFVEVPGAWKTDAFPGHGAGTYRLAIACTEPPDAALLVPGVQTASRIILNGRELGAQGQVGLTPQDHRSGFPLRTLVSGPMRCPSELRIHVSNFEAPRGGLVRGVMLGDHGELERLRLQAAASGGAVVATGFVLGFFSILMYLGRRRDPIALLFAVLCFGLAIANGLAPWRERVLQSWLGGMFDMHIQLRILVAAYTVTTSVYPLMLRRLYPRVASRRVANAIAVVGFSLAVLYMAVPIRFVAHVVLAAWASSSAAVVFSCWTLARAIARREPGAPILLASLGLLVLGMFVQGILGSRSPGTGWVDFAQLGLVLAPAWLMAQRFSRALDSEELRAIEQGERADLLVRATKAGVLDRDIPGGVVRASDRYREMLGLSATADASQLPGLASLVHPDDAGRVDAALALPRGSGQPGVHRHEAVEFRMCPPGGDPIWVHSEAISVHGENGEVLRHIRTFSDISHLKATERQLAETQSRLVEEARQAGMAQIATNVLHNVGNVLTSVNVSAHQAAERVRHSRTARVADVAQLLETRLGEGADTRDEKVRLLPGYMRELSRELDTEREQLLADLARLRTSVDHVQNVVAMQQSYAGASRVLQPARVTDLVDDALRLQEELLQRRGIEVRRDYARLPEAPLDRTRILQVLVNLFENAAHAMEGVPPGARTLDIEVRHDAGMTSVRVTDSGCGIQAEHLARIFSHGFTTKPQGHGFGLHACALAAREMGGELAVHSDGRGTGASFTLRIPTTALSAATAEAREQAT